MSISVVIPAYNEALLLPITLNSLKNLKIKPDEIIVVDGGSTDQTVQVAQEFGAKVFTIPHRGIGFARQKGLEAAKGEIIVYTDADTIVPADWLNKISDTLNQTGVICVFGTFRVPSGRWFYRFYINTVQPLLNQILFWFGVPMAAGQNLAFRKNAAIRAGGFPQEYKIAEDIEMVRRLKTQGKIIFRQDLVVTSSGRRGDEGLKLIWRMFKAFTYYFLFRRADKIGFPDIR